MFFSDWVSEESRRPGGMGGADVWFATRPNVAEAFGEPMNLGGPLNTEWHEGGLNVSSDWPADGSAAYFISDRPGGSAAHEADPDIWQALWVTSSDDGAYAYDVPPTAAPRSVGSEAEVNLFPGGELGADFRAYIGSTVNILGGTVAANFTADVGSLVNVYGGTIGAGMTAEIGSQVNILGGSIDDGFAATRGSTVSLFGQQFAIAGEDITDSLAPNVPELVVDRNVTLSGVLADGSEFSFDLNRAQVDGEDHFPGNANVQLVLLNIERPGDYNDNGTVDAPDYNVWRDTFGDTGLLLPADGNGNGIVDAPDYIVWRDNFGNAGASVPEPASLSLVVLAAALVALLRRRLQSA